MYLLDTIHCSKILNGDEILTSKMRSLSGAAAATSVVVRGELLFMALNSGRRDDNLPNILAVLNAITTIGIDEGVADRFAQIKVGIFGRWGPRERAQRRHATIGQLGFSENDLWIAATALHHGLRLVTSDGDFRRIAEVVSLQTEDWHIPSPANG